MIESPEIFFLQPFLGYMHACGGLSTFEELPGIILHGHGILL